MNTLSLPLLLSTATHAGIIAPVYSPQHRANILARARRAHKRNIAEPGDCRGDSTLLATMAIAEAVVGRSAGWIPEVQRIACKLAEIVEARNAREATIRAEMKAGAGE